MYASHQSSKKYDLSEILEEGPVTKKINNIELNRDEREAGFEEYKMTN